MFVNFSNPMIGHKIIIDGVKALKKAENLTEMLPIILNYHSSINLASKREEIRNILKEQYLEAIFKYSDQLTYEVKSLIKKIFNMSVQELYKYISEADISEYAKEKFLNGMNQLHGNIKN